jgi:hypothetical protein
MEVADAIECKKAFEKDLLWRIETFEKKTGVGIASVRLQHRLMATNNGNKLIISDVKIETQLG